MGEELWPTFNLRQGENTILPAPWVKTPSPVHQGKTERASLCCPLRPAPERLFDQEHIARLTFASPQVAAPPILIASTAGTLFAERRQIWTGERREGKRGRCCLIFPFVPFNALSLSLSRMWKITDARFPFRDLISRWVALLLPRGVDGQRVERNAGLRDGQEGYGESRSDRKGSRRGG